MIKNDTYTNTLNKIKDVLKQHKLTKETNENETFLSSNLRIKLNEHKGTVWDIKFSPDNEIVATCSSDKTIILWDYQLSPSNKNLGKPLITLANGHTDTIHSICFSPDGKYLASGSSDKTILIWDLFTDKIGTFINKFNDSTNSVRKVCFNNKGDLLAAGGHDKIIYIWDFNSSKLVHKLFSHSLTICDIKFSFDDNFIASASHDKTAMLWDIHTNSNSNTNFNYIDTNTFITIEKPILVLKEHGHHVRALDISPDNKLIATGSSDCLIKLFCIEKNNTANYGKSIMIIDKSETNIRSLCFSYKTYSKYLISGNSDGKILIWNLVLDYSENNYTYSLYKTLSDHSNSITSICLASDGNSLASSSSDQSCYIFR